MHENFITQAVTPAVCSVLKLAKMYAALKLYEYSAEAFTVLSRFIA
jgi:hypothetical protein